MKQRVITAMVLLAVLAVVVWQIYSPLFIIVVAFLSAVAANEIMKCAKIQNNFILVIGTIIGGIIPLEASPSVLEPWISTGTWKVVITAVPSTVQFAVLIIIYLLAMLKGYSKTKFEDVAIAVIGSVVIPCGFGFFAKLRDIDGYGKGSQIGIFLIFFALICALGTDVGAQLGGMALGKTKMSPNISPKKTVEGAVCGIIFSMLLNAAALTIYNHLAITPLTQKQAMVLMIAEPFVAFLGMMGDLSASVLKRNFGVKDFGKIFPGHGGVMDRFDSSLFTIPITYSIVAVFFELGLR